MTVDPRAAALAVAPTVLTAAVARTATFSCPVAFASYAVGRPAYSATPALYEATRHYFAWYALYVLELPDHVVAQQLGHTDGGTLVRELYGHPDAAIARERIRAAFRVVPVVAALPVSHAVSHGAAGAVS